MNKKLLLCNLAWLTFTLVLIVYSGNANTSKMNSVTSSITQPPTGCPDDYVNFMDPQFLLDGISRYRKYQWNAANEKMKKEKKLPDSFEDARSCWYSLDRLKNLICLTEQNAGAQGWTSGELGIRFYYATYPENEKQEVEVQVNNPPISGHVNFRPINVNVGWHHTLFMVPTHFNGDTHLNEDVFLIRNAIITEKSGVPKIQESNVKFTNAPVWNMLLNQKSNTLIKILAIGQPLVTNPSGKNQGMLCPPSCNGATATMSLADSRNVQ